MQAPLVQILITARAKRLLENTVCVDGRFGSGKMTQPMDASKTETYAAKILETVIRRKDTIHQMYGYC